MKKIKFAILFTYLIEIEEDLSFSTYAAIFWSMTNSIHILEE